MAVLTPSIVVIWGVYPIKEEIVMTLAVFFWVIYLVALIFGGWGYWRAEPDTRVPFGSWFVLFILIGVLGLKVFGSPIQG
jgi:hypothetical protein